VTFAVAALPFSRGLVRGAALDVCDRLDQAESAGALQRAGKAFGESRQGA
jgi:hypothetical protein